MATLTPPRNIRPAHREDKTLRIGVLVARVVLLGGLVALVVFGLG